MAEVGDAPPQLRELGCARAPRVDRLAAAAEPDVIEPRGRAEHPPPEPRAASPPRECEADPAAGDAIGDGEEAADDDGAPLRRLGEPLLGVEERADADGTAPFISPGAVPGNLG